MAREEGGGHGEDGGKGRWEDVFTDYSHRRKREKGKKRNSYAVAG